MATEIVFPPSEVFLRASPAPAPQPSTGDDDDQEVPRQSEAKSGKRKAPAPKQRAANKAKAASAAQNAVDRPKMSKSRTGCITCKLKRLKCDETKPTCLQCQRRKVECGGYKKDFKWRSFDEVSGRTVAPCPQKRKQSSSAGQPSITIAEPRSFQRDSVGSSKPRELPSSTSTSPRSDHASGSLQQQSLDLSRVVSSDNDGERLTSPPQAVSPSKHSSHSDHVLARPSTPPSPADISAHDGTTSIEAYSPVQEVVDPSLLTSTSDSLPGMTAADIDSLLASCDPALMAPLIQDLDLDTEEIPRHDLMDPMELSESLPLGGLDSLALIPGDLGWATGQHYKSLPMELDHSPDGVEMIAIRFDQLTCGILSVKNGPTENPWRTLVWPMAQSSPSLFHAVCAMTSFHSSRREPQFKVKGHEHMQLCFQNLSEGLREDSVTLENAIATSITLAFAQGWSELTSSGSVYIKGARSIIGKALTEHRHNARQGIELARLKFLCNAWVYMDVIARLTCIDEDETDEYEQIFSAFSNPAVDHEGFGIDFGLPIDSCLDPLMGCANTLFPLIGRTANLARRVRRSASTPLTIIDQARELKDLIEAWRPPMYIQPPEDASSTVEHGVQTAEAYRWATLLHLHQTVPEIPMATSSQLAAKVLVLLATVPLSSRFVIIHIFPLMAAGCEAVSSEDRAWVRRRWAAMGERLDIGSIEKCVDITEEVWQRRDESSPVGRQSLVSTANMQGRDLRRPSYDLNPASSSFGLGSSSRFPPGWNIEEGFAGIEGRGLSIPGLAEPTWPQVLEWNDDGDIIAQHQLGGRLHWLGVMKEWGWEVLLG